MYSNQKNASGPMDSIWYLVLHGWCWSRECSSMLETALRRSDTDYITDPDKALRVADWSCAEKDEPINVLFGEHDQETAY